jgi:hypothetical protein
MVSQQLQKLQAHMTAYDMSAIFNCVYPLQDSEAGIEIDSSLKRGVDGSIVTTSLFTKSHLLNPDEVALSQLWLHYWAGHDADDTSFQDDQWVTMKYIENNTETELFNKCLEHLKEFPANAHGGPLLLALIQEQIQNSSEPAMKNLLSLVSTLKISKYPGEDVSKYVTVIRAVHSILLSASEAGNLHFDQDNFVQTVVERLQTTSVPEFNEPYRLMMAKAIDDMDQPTVSSTGRILRSRARRTKFIPLEAILTGAEAKYSRLVANSKWNVSKHTSVANHLENPGATVIVEPPKPSEGEAARKFKHKCWNCGAEDHRVHQCPHPRDEARIKAQFEKYKVEAEKRGRFIRGGRGGRGGGRGRGSGTQPTVSPSAAPAIRAAFPTKINRKGVEVIDSGKLHALRQEAAMQTIAQKQTEEALNKFASTLLEKLPSANNGANRPGQETPSTITTQSVSFAPTAAASSTFRGGVDQLEALRESILAASQSAWNTAN